MSNRVNYSKIVSEASEIAKSLIDSLPHLNILFAKESDTNNSGNKYADNTSLFGGFVREIVSSVVTPTENRDTVNHKEKIMTYLLENEGDVDIRTAVPKKTITDFFRAIMANGGCVEYAGDGYRTSTSSLDTKIRYLRDIDLSTKNDVIIPWGNYFVYHPITVEGAADDTPSTKWIRYDIWYNVKSNLNIDFVLNGCTYPFVKSENTKSGIYDIIDKKIRLVRNTTNTRNLLIRAYRLWTLGYTFDNDGYLQRLFTHSISSKSEYNAEYCSAFMYDTSTPSVNPNSMLVRHTKHLLSKLTKDIIMSHSGIREMLEKTPLPLGIWHLPDSGTGEGVTLDTITVYISAIAYLFPEKLTYSDIVKGSNKKVIVLVELEVPKWTRFKRNSDERVQGSQNDRSLKFKFEKALVKQFYAYPRRRVEHNIVVKSECGSGFEYIKGEMVEPNSRYNESYHYTGIHAFHDMNTAWATYRDYPKLTDYDVETVSIDIYKNVE